MVKAIVSLSGGMDSATVLALAKEEDRDVLAVSFLYGSKHGQYENAAAINIARWYGVPHRFVDLTTVMSGFKSDLLLTGGDIPEGHYEAESMSRTVVPARNLIFASVLAGIAVSENAKQIWLGVHAGDHAIYPDCRPRFIASLEKTIQLATDKFINVYTPFLGDKKSDILTKGILRNVPYHLTRTCYKAQAIACGKCGSCQERLEAFTICGASDPIEYESREILPKVQG